MYQVRRIGCGFVFLLAIAWAMQARADTLAFTAGQAVEVREGDTWSPATFEVQEGHKFQIKYTDGGTEEWVTADRIRQPGAPAPTAAASGTAAKPAGDKPAAASRTKYEAGEKLEAKWGGLWRTCSINNKRTGDWYLVTYPPGNSQEWVEWWRLRKLGKNDGDSLPPCPPNGFYQKGDEPPRPDAGDGPAANAHVGNKPGVAGKANGADGDDPVAAFSHPVTPSSLASSNDIVPTFSGAWAVPVDPIDPKQQISSAPVGCKSAYDRMRGSLYHAGQYVLLVDRDMFGGVTKSSTVEKINLAASSSQGVMTFDTLSCPIGISPNGKRVLARSDGWGFGKKKRLDVWSLGTAGPEHVISFIPMTAGEDRLGDIVTADFTDDDHAFTLLTDGDLIGWDLATAKAIWRVSLDEHAKIVLSPGRKNLFVTHENQLLCLDAATGAVKGSIDGGRALEGDVSISPDGTRLVSAMATVVSVYDLKAGTFLGDIGLPTSSVNDNGDRGMPTAVMIDAQFALLGNTLMDVNKRTAIWTYAETNHAFAAGGRVWNLLATNRRATLVSAKLPQDSATRADAKVPAESPLVLKPGDKVALDISITAPADKTAKITDALKAEIARAGFTIDPSATAHIVARTQDGASYNKTYRGPMFQQETVSVTNKITSLSVEVNGKPAWQTSSVNAPGFMVERSSNQSIGDAVRAADQYNVDFLFTAHLPGYVLPAPDTIGFRKSKWLLGGVKDVP